MNQKQIKTLCEADKHIQQCIRCDLHKNGHCKPFWTTVSRYMMVLEAPGKDEIIENEPVVGIAGQKLWTEMDKFNLYKNDFFIINATNCRPVVGNRNGKPTLEQMNKCRDWIHLYFNIIQPKHVMVFGNYATQTLLNESSGITEKNAKTISGKIFDKTVNITYSVHPACMIYRGVTGKKEIQDAISSFKESL